MLGQCNGGVGKSFRPPNQKAHRAPQSGVEITPNHAQRISYVNLTEFHAPGVGRSECGLVVISLGSETSKGYGGFLERALEAADTAVHALQRALAASPT
jgi:hypothetical protein